MPFPALQKAGTGLGGQIGQQPLQAFSTNLDTGVLCFQKHRFAGESIHQPDPGVAFKDKEPRLMPGVEFPVRFRRQVDPLEHEMRAGDQ